jgi:tetratricopeptide (TPR) repeat protein
MIPARPLACLALLLALTGTAIAQPTPTPPPATPAGTPAQRKEKARTIAADAGRKYNLGQFDVALTLYTEAYDTFPAAGLLFNLAQCHRSLGNHERAIFFYEGYLREKPTAANRDVVEELLTEERGLLARQREAEAEAEAEAKQREAEKARLDAEQKRQADEAAERRAEEARRDEDQRRRDEEERRRTGLLAPAGGGAAGAAAEGGGSSSILHRWWFWTAIGVGVAAATAGTLIYLGAQEDSGLPAGTLGTLDGRDD